MLVGLTFASTWFEGLGIALLLPLLSGGDLYGTDLLSRIVSRFLETFGLPKTLTGVLIAVVAVAFAKALLTFIAISYQYWISAKVTQDLRRRLVNALSRLEFTRMLQSNSSDLAQLTLQRTAETAGAFLTFARVIPHALTIVLFATILTVIDVKLALVVALVALPIAWGLRMPAKASQRHSQALVDETNQLSLVLWQTLFSFKYLASTGALGRMHKTLFAYVRRLAVRGYRIGFVQAAANSIPQPLVALFLAGVIAWQTRAGAGVAVGLVVLVYLYRMMNEFFALQAQWQAYVAVSASVDALRDGIADLEKNEERQGGSRFESLKSGITFESVDVAFGDRVVLHDISFEIPRNKTIALVGESGAGKTTLVDVLTGLIKPARGRVRIDGTDMAAIDLLSWRSSIGYVPQDPATFLDTIANNIALWADNPADPAVLAKVREAARLAHAEKFINALPEGLNTCLGERGTPLSGGQRQRVAIARELYKDPALLLLDEATSALDPESEDAIRRSLEDIRGRTTIVLIAHRLATLRSADEVVVLHDGRIVERGTYQELLAREGSRLHQVAKLLAP